MTSPTPSRLDDERLSINDAAARGIPRVRLPQWANPLDHLAIDIMRDGKPGPWTHLYCPSNRAINGRDPVDILATQMNYNKREWLRYEGPAWDTDVYQAAAAMSAPSSPDGEKGR